MDVNLVIKVSDFGLAESLDASKEYFRQDQDNAIKLPIKWLAPESICDKVFSEKSDVVNLFRHMYVTKKILGHCESPL